MKTKFLLSICVSLFFSKLCESPTIQKLAAWLGLDRVKTNGKTKETEQEECPNVDPNCRIKIAGSQARPDRFEW